MAPPPPPPPPPAPGAPSSNGYGAPASEYESAPYDPAPAPSYGVPDDGYTTPASNLPAPSLSHIAIAVVDTDQTTRSRLAMQLGETAAPFPSVDSLGERLNGTPVVA